jgi:hypothetical protein
MLDVFRRPHHNAILSILHSLDRDLFHRAECYFGGGTAVALQLDEYRESIDIDFLCASQAGYRLLRTTIVEQGLDGIIYPASKVIAIREFRLDQYGLRTFLGIGDVKIKFEIIREARIPLDGKLDERLRIPVLNRIDMYVEKLLANADRWSDQSVLNRDVIDLSMMISRWGSIPEEAWRRAHEAYGQSVDLAYAKAVDKIRTPDWLRNCMLKLSIDPSLFDEILKPHGGPKPSE